MQRPLYYRCPLEEKKTYSGKRVQPRLSRNKDRLDTSKMAKSRKSNARLVGLVDIEFKGEQVKVADPDLLRDPIALDKRESSGEY